MGQCPSCGAKKVFLKNAKCNICGKIGCEECFTFLFRVIDNNSSFDESWYSCSKECFEEISSKIENSINTEDIKSEPNNPPVHLFIEREILKRYTPKDNPSLFGQIKKRMRSREYALVFTKDYNPLYEHDSVLWDRIARHAMLSQASHFETLKEFENAAKIYQSLGMHEKAGQIRAKPDEATVKNTGVSPIDAKINTLLQQVRDSGITAVYRCPRCNGKIKVGNKSTLNSLRTCECCRSEFEAADLADFLETVLS